MASRAAFAAAVLATIAQRASLRIRAGAAPHRFLGIWAVVVDDRVFVRSWRDQPSGWHRAWRADPVGAIQVGAREVGVRAVPVTSERVRDAVSRAYRDKYRGPGSVSYAEGMDAPARRETTLELRPLAPASRPGAATRAPSTRRASGASPRQARKRGT